MIPTEWLRDAFSHDDFWSESQLVAAWCDENDSIEGLMAALLDLLDAGELGKCDDIYYRTENFLDPNQTFYNLTDAGYERTEMYNGKEATESETRDTEPPAAR